jgi:hypothetical protein
LVLVCILIGQEVQATGLRSSGRVECGEIVCQVSENRLSGRECFGNFILGSMFTISFSSFSSFSLNTYHNFQQTYLPIFSLNHFIKGVKSLLNYYQRSGPTATKSDEVITN